MSWPGDKQAGRFDILDYYCVAVHRSIWIGPAKNAWLGDAASLLF